MAINDGKPIMAKVSNDKDFYFCFLQMFREQLKIKWATDIHVLTFMCLNMEYNSTRVKITTSDRKRMCDEIGIANSHLSTSFKRLREIGLIDGENGEYEINPFLAWKGNLSERSRLLESNGIEIKVRFSKTSPETPYNPFNGGSKEFDK